MLENIKRIIGFKRKPRVRKCSEAEMDKALKVAVCKAETQANIRFN